MTAPRDTRDWPHIGVALMQPRPAAGMTLVSADPDVAAEHRASLRQRARRRRGAAGAARAGSRISRRDNASRRAIWSTSQHLCGTAPMGVDGDPYAVVDPRCRVHGVDGLWVIDGSVLPTITSRGPHATIVMLGHRAAEFVV